MKSGIKKTLSVGATSLLTLSSAQAAQLFGFPGMNGADGIAGNPGASVPAQTITVAPGTAAVSYDFAGGAGSVGGDGQNGTPATNCVGNYGGDSDLVGAAGGSGGNAGVGGDGGNGANVTVIYTPSASGNPFADLHNVSLNLAGGAPGASGANAGAGQPGCECQEMIWTFNRQVPETRQVCTGGAVAGARPELALAGVVADGAASPDAAGPQPKPQPPKPGPSQPSRPQPTQPPHPPTPVPPPHPPAPVCHPETFFVNQSFTHTCQGGGFGQSGMIPNASSGQTGSVTLRPSNLPTAAELPSAQVPVGTLPFSATLSQDNWATATGAQALFAPGSVVADQYTVYAGRSEAPVSITWNARRTTSDIASVVFGVSLTNGQPSLTYDASQLWASVSQRAGEATAFSVDAAATPAEALAVTATLSGSKAGTILTLTDPHAISDFVATSAFAKIESHGILGWYTHYNAQVPAANIVEVSPGQLTIQVGQIYPSANSGDLNSGKELRVTLTITRSLGGQSGSEAPIVIDQKLQ